MRNERQRGQLPRLYGYGTYDAMNDASPRSDRIELRATRDEKRLLARAAAEERLDLTSFILRAALPEAHRIVDEAEKIVLSRRDRERVLQLLENPPAAPERLIRAARAVRAGK